MTANRPLNDEDLHAVLEWYQTAGVDFAVAESPLDRFAVPPPRARQKLAAEPVRAAEPATADAALPIGGDPLAAETLASAAQSLDELKAAMAGFEGCSLRFRATQLVFADGNPEAPLMLVGEAPGSEEDRLGKPFVGRAGQLLDRMLAAIGLDRRAVYIVNMVPWRPPGNRNPTAEELAVCLPFLRRQVALVKPKLMMTLGNVPTQTLFDTTTGITRMRGQWRDLEVGGHSVPTLATLHPAFLLRTPSAKRHAWQDLLSVRAALQKESLPAG